MKWKAMLWVAVVALSFMVFSLTACTGADQEQKEREQAQQEQEEVAQPTSTEPVASSPVATSGRGLVGTWEATETDLGPDLGGGLLTFSEDGTFQAQPLPVDAPELILSGEYSVDDSHITFIDPERGETQTEYTLEGDTLTTYTKVEDPEFPIDTKTIYQRKS